MEASSVTSRCRREAVPGGLVERRAWRAWWPLVGERVARRMW